MGASGSREARIWNDLCNMESEEIRAATIDQLLLVPGFISFAHHAGVYGPITAWHQAFKRGWKQPFPYATGRGDTIRYEGHPTSTIYQTPVPQQTQIQTQPQTQLVVSSAAKALDYFQESLLLLGISETELLTRERLKSAYKKASLSAHPDKGGSETAFDALNRAYVYVGKIIDRVTPSSRDSEKINLLITEENTKELIGNTLNARIREEKQFVAPPVVKLSAKKLDMNVFNQLFEENRLPDPVRDTGYGDWIKQTDPTETGIANSGSGIKDFESVVRSYAQKNPGAIIRRNAPETLVGSRSGTELGEDGTNFTAPFGADIQFTDIKEAYTTGSVAYLEVADVKVTERSATSVEDAMRIREVEMARVDPDESTRIAAAAAALEEKERRRKLRLAQTDTAIDSWFSAMRGRFAVTDA